jgi:uncharacterized membrane protein
MPELTEPSSPPPPADATTPPGSLPPNVAACLACVFPLIGGLIFLSVEKKNAFVRYYAMQSVYFGGASFVAYVVLTIIRWIMGRVPVFGALFSWVLSMVWVLVAILWLVVYLVLIVKSITGKEWEIPYLGRLARQQLATTETPSS